MRLNALLALPVAGLLLLTSCKNNSGTTPAVPKDAAVVVHISNSSLSSKLSWKEVQETDWFREMYKEAKDTLAQKLLSNPEAAGIDTKADLVFFLKKQGKGGYLVFEGSLTDAARFEAFNQQLLAQKGTTAAVTKDGDFSHLKMDEGALVTWDKNRFSYTADAPFMNAMAAAMSAGDGTQNTASFGVDSLKLFARQTLTLKEGLEEDDRYARLVKEAGDVHVWMNSEHYYSGLTGGMLSMMKLNTLLEDNISATTLNFDNGKIALTSKQYYGKEVSKLLDKHKMGSISADLLNRIPSDSIAGVLAMNCPPAALKDLLVLTGMDGMANMMFSRMNYTLDELLQASNGEVLVSVSDVRMEKKTETNPFTQTQQVTTKPNMNFLFAASVNNQPSFEKLIGILKAEAGPSASEVNMEIKNKWFAASNSAGHLAGFHTGNKRNAAFASKISGHPFGVYVDLQRILRSTQETPTGTAFGAMQASINFWQDIVLYGGEWKDGTMSYTMEVNLVDKNTNSLKQLNKYFSQLYLANKVQQNDVVTESIEDTTTALPAE
ncbi:MAG TPA: DUF4836 family protein [Chitinophagaceae bacterium]|jgi:hypothetical protein|nr:DUF4836 family protein [Chitinophagaceae bacterium]